MLKIMMDMTSDAIHYTLHVCQETQYSTVTTVHVKKYIATRVGVNHNCSSSTQGLRYCQKPEFEYNFEGHVC